MKSLSRLQAVEHEAAERAEPSDGLRIALRGQSKRALDGERMKFVLILGNLKSSLRSLCFLLFLLNSYGLGCLCALNLGV